MANKALNKNKTYLVLNYNPSPVSITTKDKSYLIPGGYSNAPASIPFDLNEIHYINNASKVFKIGLLYFEDEWQEQLYEELRINDWKNILREKDIEDLILNPTTGGLEKIVSIKDRMYFERIYGVYLGLKNAGLPISNNVENVMRVRRKELMDGHIKTEITVRADTRTEANSETNDKIAEMQKQIELLTQMLMAKSEQEEGSKKQNKTGGNKEG